MELPADSGASKGAGSGADTLGGGEDMKRAYHEMKKAYDDMKLLLKKSMGECMRLSDEVVKLEGQVGAGGRWTIGGCGLLHDTRSPNEH